MNFEQLLYVKDPVQKDALITEMAKVCIEESEKARLGWGHTFMKFFATTATYSSLLTAPILAVLGSLWYFADKINLLLTIENLSIALPSLGALIASDIVFGKIFGIRPITLALLAVCDAYRNEVKKASDMVEKSYVDQEESVKDLLKDNKKLLLEELKTVYAGVAKSLESQKPAEIQKLAGQISPIEKGLVSIGLTRIEVAQILDPLKTELKLYLMRHAPQKRAS